MDMIADLLLGAGALGVAFYCHMLARRLRAFQRLEGGMGSAIAVLSQQVDEMTQALGRAQLTAGDSADRLEERVARAEAAAKRLELLLASLHDLPEPERAAS